MWQQGTDAPNFLKVQARVERVIAPFLASKTPRRHVEQGWRFEEVWEAALCDATRVRVCVQPLPLFQGDQILGMYAPGLVVMHQDFMDEFPRHPKRTFALYHEVAGHALNHEYVFADHRVDGLSDSERTFEPSVRLKLEREANAAAASAAAPRELLVAALDLEREKGRGPFLYRGPAVYDDFSSRGTQVDSYRDYCRQIGKLLRPYFDYLSAECLGYRLEGFKLVDRSDGLDDAQYRVGAPITRASGIRFNHRDGGGPNIELPPSRLPPPEPGPIDPGDEEAPF